MGFCEICNKEYAHMYEHRRVHDIESRFFCQYPECSKSYASRTALESHIRVNHTKEKPFKCEQGCDKTFPTAFARVQHHRTHTQTKMYTCPECGSSYPTFSQIYQHKFRHSTERYPCPVPDCGKDYSNPYTVNVHCKKAHPAIAKST